MQTLLNLEIELVRTEIYLDILAASSTALYS